MTPEDREHNIQVVDGLIDQTGVKSIWDLFYLVEQSPPSFEFDSMIGYSILGIVAMSSIMLEWPIVINKKTISEMYHISMDEVEQYFDWFCHLGILRKS